MLRCTAHCDDFEGLFPNIYMETKVWVYAHLCSVRLCQGGRTTAQDAEVYGHAKKHTVVEISGKLPSLTGLELGPESAQGVA